MITRTELGEIARFKRLSLKNAERDYLLDICLHTVSRHGRGLVFKGGTALYKLHSLNRFSEDLDFSVERGKADLWRLQDEIIRAGRLLGIAARASEPDEHQRAVNLQLFFSGPLYDGSKGSATRVILNVSLRERPRHAEWRLYNPVFKELGSFELRVLRVDELLAEKIRAVMTRNRPRDVYDVWFLLKNGVMLDRGLVERKLRAYDGHFSIDGFSSAAKRKRGMWEPDLRDLVGGDLPAFDAVIRDTLDILERRPGPPVR
ncbi:MAG: nucleotidyl transferase AbiEii/AbiGii toxin family protein [Euryarchaeota archaeon]|nr:nucleotidyl transferase AbiEii/AbiGii toxin family protein [Euryarchaeota archaeon]